MSYLRTNEIKKKQSHTMRQKFKSGDYDMESKKRNHKKTIDRKRKAGERLGRKSVKDGGVYKKKGLYLPCPICRTPVYYQPKQLKSGRVKRCSKKCLSADPNYKKKLSRADKSYMQTEEYKNTQRNPEIKGYQRYVLEVRGLTEETYTKNIEIINPNRYPRTLCGVDGGYNLDHIISVKECWNRGLSVEFASSVDNLQMLPWRETLDKRCFKPPKEK